MGKRRELSASGERTLTFQRARWKHWVRYFGVFVIVVLNISMVLSGIQIHQQAIREGTSFWREILSYAFVLVFDVTVLLPSLLEVDSILATPDKIIFKTLFWKSKVPWSEIIDFKNPIWLAFVVVRTPRCFYLINKRDVKPLDELIQTIEFKRPRKSKDGV